MSGGTMVLFFLYALRFSNILTMNMQGSSKQKLSRSGSRGWSLISEVAYEHSLPGARAALHLHRILRRQNPAFTVFYLERMFFGVTPSR